jgi:hypothetical protein
MTSNFPSTWYRHGERQRGREGRTEGEYEDLGFGDALAIKNWYTDVPTEKSILVSAKSYL